MDNAKFRFQERERLIDADEFSTGFYTNENYCQRMKKHIQKMKVLGGNHLDDIQDYIKQMKDQNCDNIPQLGGSHRRASKHSKKHKKSRSNKSKKSNKSRRH